MDVGPLICGIDVAPTVTGMETVESQPLDVVSVTRTVPAPGVLHNTVTLLRLDAPTIEPPVTTQPIRLLEGPCRLYVRVSYWQTAAGPVMTGVGVVWMFTSAAAVESQPEVFMATRLMVPAGPAFQRTVMDVPVLVRTVPPVTVQV